LAFLEVYTKNREFVHYKFKNGALGVESAASIINNTDEPVK
jgi:hypothetical protein